ncbi:MAG TPA: septum site-determining protein MinC, partial [Tahibacter sp.]|nr:septum site-determining protein MinC [Tahibacter sp.]
MSRPLPSFEPVGELKFGQVGIANLRLKSLDDDTLAQELRQKLDTAPHLFQRAPVVLDLSHLPQLPDADRVRAVLATVRASGMLPVGLAYGTSENEALARALDLPLFAKFRAAYETAGGAAETP